MPATLRKIAGMARSYINWHAHISAGVTTVIAFIVVSPLHFTFVQYSHNCTLRRRAVNQYGSSYSSTHFNCCIFMPPR